MSYFKKFSDFCSGFACFMALIYLFRQFMGFDVADEELGMVGKVKLFLSRTEALDRYLLFVLALMLAISVLAGCIFKKLPYLTLIFSLPPLAMAVDLIKAQYLKEYPLLFLLLCIIAFIGGVYECVRMDRADGRHRAAWGADIVSLGFAAFLVFVYRKAGALAGIAEEDAFELDHFDYEIYSLAENMDIKILLTFAAVYAGLALVSLLLSDIYFIDGILALPPAVALIYLWGAEKLTVHPEIIVTLALANFTARIIPAVSGKATYKKRHFRLVEKQI